MSESEPTPQPRRRRVRFGVRRFSSGGVMHWPRLNYKKTPGTFSLLPEPGDEQPARGKEDHA